MIHLDHISFVILFLFGLGMGLKSLTYPIGSLRTPGAGLFPLFASILLMATSAFFLIHSFFKRDQGEGTKASLFTGWDAPQRVLLSVASLVMFRYLLPFLGFAPSAFCFILCLSKFLARYSWKASAFFAALSALGVYFLFQVLLKIQMPRGVLGI